jgi:hypothetical protein
VQLGLVKTFIDRQHGVSLLVEKCCSRARAVITTSLTRWTLSTTRESLNVQQTPLALSSRWARPTTACRLGVGGTTARAVRGSALCSAWKQLLAWRLFGGTLAG